MPPSASSGNAGLVGRGQGLEEGDARALGEGVDLADAGVAHSALGHVDDALDRHLVGRVGHRLEVGEQILDLAAVIELGAAHDLVRHALLDQLFLDHPALRVGPVEQRQVAPPAALAVQPAHLVDHPRALVVLVFGVVPGDQLAADLLGPQRLGLAHHVVGDHRVGGVEDRLRRPVVLLQHHHRGVRERILKIENVPDIRLPKFVDRVVDKHAVRNVRMRRPHLEVIDRSAVVACRHRVDHGLLQFAMKVDVHRHAGPDIGERRHNAYWRQ